MKLMEIPNLKLRLDLLLMIHDLPLQVSIGSNATIVSFFLRRSNPSLEPTAYADTVWVAMQFDELLPNINLSLNAVQDVLNSTRLVQVMLYGLSIGNHINGGTKKGGQHGIALKSFPKFGDTKGINACSICTAGTGPSR